MELGLNGSDGSVGVGLEDGVDLGLLEGGALLGGGSGHEGKQEDSLCGGKKELEIVPRCLISMLTKRFMLYGDRC